MISCRRLDRSYLRPLAVLEHRVEDRRHGEQSRHPVSLDEAPSARAGSNLRSITCWPPIIVRKCGVPQPLTWNSGTTWSTTSSSVKPSAELRVQAVQVQLAMRHRRRPSAGRSSRSCRRARPSRSRRSRAGAGSVEPAASSASYSWLGDAARLAFEDDEPRPRRQRGRDRLDERREVAVEEDDLRSGVVEDVGDLVRRQADVDRVEDGARPRAPRSTPRAGGACCR